MVGDPPKMTHLGIHMHTIYSVLPIATIHAKGMSFCGSQGRSIQWGWHDDLKGFFKLNQCNWVFVWPDSDSAFQLCCDRGTDRFQSHPIRRPRIKITTSWTKIQGQSPLSSQSGHTTTGFRGRAPCPVNPATLPLVFVCFSLNFISLSEKPAVQGHTEKVCNQSCTMYCPVLWFTKEHSL